MVDEGFNLAWIYYGAYNGIAYMAPGTSLGSKRGRRLGDSYEFWWFRQGRSVVRVNGKAYEACGPRDVFLFPPNSLLKFDFDPLESSLAYIFSFALLSIPGQWPRPSRWPVKLKMPEESFLGPLFEYIAANGQNNVAPPLHMVFAVKALLLAFITGQSELTHILPQSYPPPVRRVLEWMRRFTEVNPQKRVGLSDMVKISGVSRIHLCRLFKEHLGYPPIETLYRYRITKSLTGLRAGQKIDALARTYGFAQAAHYARRFREMFGKSPTQMQDTLTKDPTIELPQLPFM